MLVDEVAVLVQTADDGRVVSSHLVRDQTSKTIMPTYSLMGRLSNRDQNESLMGRLSRRDQTIN